MIKKLIFNFIYLIFILYATINFCFADIKVNSAIFDNSEKLLILSIFKDASVNKNLQIKKVKLDEKRIYIDIFDAILTQPNKIWYFKNSNIEQIRLSQFSTEPNIVRLVIYHNDLFKPDSMKVLKSNNNIILDFNPNLLATGYYMANIYREESSSRDYYEKMSETAPPVEIGLDSFSQIAPALSNIPQETLSTIINKANSNKPTYKKDYKLKTKYFIDKLDIKQENILLYGIGTPTLEKPIYLTEPSRIVFDFPNAILNQDLHNKEFILSQSETARIAQFEQNKVRLVITTNVPEKFRPIISASLQSILISNDDKINSLNLYNEYTQLKDLKVIPLNELTDLLSFSFEMPVIYSIKRDDKKFELIFYNAMAQSCNYIENAFKFSNINSVKVQKSARFGYKITIPIKNSSQIAIWESIDAKNIKVQIKTPKEIYQCSPMNSDCFTNTIVLDPGHGGVDVGALRASINEKDINLDVAKKVANILIKKGFNVEMTRWQDESVSLQERVDFAQDKKADLFVSIHANSSVKPEINGIESHYYHEYSKDFAYITQEKMIEKTQAFDRGIFQSKFYVINHTTMPAILLEIGFISNDNERNELLSEKRKQQTAGAIAEAIIEFIIKSRKQGKK